MKFSVESLTNYGSEKSHTKPSSCGDLVKYSSTVEAHLYEVFPPRIVFMKGEIHFLVL